MNPKVLLLDGDGVIWINDKPIEGAVEALERIRGLGIRLVLVTNNCSKTRAKYKAYTNGLAPGLFEECDIFSSGFVTAQYLRNKGIKKVFVSGFEALKEEIQMCGIEVCEDGAEAVVVSKSDTFNIEQLETGTNLIKNNGALLIGTNPDPNFPMGDSVLVCGSGAFVSAFASATGVTPTVIGKPNTVMFETVLSCLGVTKDEVMMVGDRICTDIAFASHHGARSVLVLSGVDTKEMGENAPPEDRPTTILPSLVELADLFTQSSF